MEMADLDLKTVGDNRLATGVYDKEGVNLGINPFPFFFLDKRGWAIKGGIRIIYKLYTCTVLPRSQSKIKNEGALYMHMNLRIVP